MLEIDFFFFMFCFIFITEVSREFGAGGQTRQKQSVAMIVKYVCVVNKLYCTQCH